MKKICVCVCMVLLCAVMALGLLTGCESLPGEPLDLDKFNTDKPMVGMKLSTGDNIYLFLDAESAPRSVANFMEYVKSGFYEGTVFHRIINNFMIQAGGFEEKNGVLHPKEGGDPIVGEFRANGIANPLKHVTGVLSMARTNDPNSATAQFFIVSETSPHLDGNYAAFGWCALESIEVIQRLQKVPTGTGYIDTGVGLQPADDVPLEPITILKVVYREGK